MVLAPSRGTVDDPDVVVAGRPVAVPYQGTVAPICLSMRSARVVGRAMAGFRPDVVHAHEPLSPSTGMLATLRSPAPVVGTFHAHTERSALLTAAAPFLRPVWSRVRVKIAVSEAAAAFVGRRFRGDVRVIPNGCDVDRFASAPPVQDAPDGRRIMWVGRLDPQKGFGVALRAFERLLADHPDAALIVAGDGRDRALVERLAAGTRPRVHLLGSVLHGDLPGYLAAADVFVAPALGQESFGIVLVEAMAAGLPVVATDIAGYREVVRHDQEGLLVPPEDPAALADSLGRVLSDQSLAARLGEAGRRRAQRYRWETVVQEIEQAYADAFATAGTRKE
jgi:phosphatidylinositol alpha-mannosyltransferase